MATRKPRRASRLGSIIPQHDHFRARYERAGKWHTPGYTFSSFKLADDWLLDEQRLIERDEWTPPADRRAAKDAEDATNALTFGDYAERWIEQRQVRGRALKDRTRAGYRALLERQLQPFATVPIVGIERPAVVAWFHSLDASRPTVRGHAYALFRSVMASAVEDKLIPENPVHIKGAGAKPRKPEVELFTAEEVGKLADLMPPRHRAAVLVAAWCGLRFGELIALRRSDIELDGDTPRIHVRRGVVMVGKEQIVTTPKSDSGERTVPIPPTIVDDLRKHLKDHAQWGPDGLVFPPTHPGYDYLTPGQLYGHRPTYDKKTGAMRKQGGGYYRARHLLGRDDLSFHKLRHFAGTRYAVAGATLKELMSLLGHADPGIAMRYQHAAQDRMAELAARVALLDQVDGGGESPSTAL